MLLSPPQFLNQAPPGAQQLLLPDLPNVSHLGQAIALAIIELTPGVMTDVVIGVLTISSRSGNGGRDASSRVASVVNGVGVDVHSVCDIDPDVPANMRVFIAFELTQAAPQSSCLKDVA